MKPTDFAESAPGQLVQVSFSTGSGYAFEPFRLPRTLEIDAEIAVANERAALALGNLNGSGRWLPNPTLLLRSFMSREALSSSRIEGTHADFQQLVLAEAQDSGVINPDIQEVTNYIDTLNAAWARPSERPFTAGFMLQLHHVLMSGVRGQDKHPGQFRAVQVVIGRRGQNAQDAKFVPPPAEMVRGLIDDLCDFVEASPGDMPQLVCLAMMHYQFETIHPFEDGNGRLGRLLMPVILQYWGRLDQPLLYLSEFFETHRTEYTELMLRVSTRGEWKPWILFVLEAIRAQSDDAVHRGQQLIEYREELRAAYMSSRSGALPRLIDWLFQYPAVSGNDVAEALEITLAAALRAISTLEDDGVLTEVTGWKRNRLFVASEIVRIIEQPAVHPV